MPHVSKTIVFDGLGSHWECEILDEKLSLKSYNSIQKSLLAKLDDFTSNYSRFDENSLIGQLNSNHEIINPPAEMIEMLNFAYQMFQATGGVFNISVGGELHARGYGSTKNTAAVQSDFWKNIIIQNDKIITPKNSVIDFGGFGKGWLIDGFAGILVKNGINEFIVNGGGDLYVRSNTPIEISLEHPFDGTKSVGQTQISVGALAASSTIKRVWTKDDEKYHHIIDPSTGKPSSSNIIATFVKSDSAVIADVMATVLIIKPELNDRLSKKFNLKTILLSSNQFKS